MSLCPTPDHAMHFLLIYDVAADYMQRRAAGDPPDSAVLLFRADDDGPARRFAERDPYVLEGIVTGWTVKPWTTVVGAEASQRVPQG